MIFQLGAMGLCASALRGFRTGHGLGCYWGERPWSCGMFWPSDVLRAESTGRGGEEEGRWDEDTMFSWLVGQALP